MFDIYYGGQSWPLSSRETREEAIEAAREMAKRVECLQGILFIRERGDAAPFLLVGRYTNEKPDNSGAYHDSAIYTRNL